MDTYAAVIIPFVGGKSLFLCPICSKEYARDPQLMDVDTVCVAIELPDTQRLTGLLCTADQVPNGTLCRDGKCKPTVSFVDRQWVNENAIAIIEQSITLPGLAELFSGGETEQPKPKREYVDNALMHLAKVQLHLAKELDRTARSLDGYQTFSPAWFRCIAKRIAIYDFVHIVGVNCEAAMLSDDYSMRIERMLDNLIDALDGKLALVDKFLSGISTKDYAYVVPVAYKAVFAADRNWLVRLICPSDPSLPEMPADLDTDAD